MKAKELLIRVLLLLIGLTIAHLGIGTIICTAGWPRGRYIPSDQREAGKKSDREI